MDDIVLPQLPPMPLFDPEKMWVWLDEIRRAAVIADRNLAAIAGIWSALLRDHLQPGHTVTPQLVCLLMAGLKLARAANRPSHREHALDTVGYMALMERCGWIDPK